MPKQLSSPVKATTPPLPQANDTSQPIAPLPSSIELSPTQREILGLIVQDQTSIHGPAQPERTILLWSDGISESATARELHITEQDVRSLRRHWLASTRRIAATEKKFEKAFNDLVSLIFRIPNEEPPPDAL